VALDVVPNEVEEEVEDEGLVSWVVDELPGLISGF